MSTKSGSVKQIPPPAQYPKPDEYGNETGPCCAHAYADGFNECRRLCAEAIDRPPPLKEAELRAALTAAAVTAPAGDGVQLWSLPEAVELVNFFGGSNASVSVQHDGVVGKRAWLTEYPEEGSHSLGSHDTDTEAYNEPTQECSTPPRGWYCTRPEGHEGPCCAWPTAALVERFKLAARTLIRDRQVFAEDVESMYDALRAIEALAACGVKQ